MHAKRPESLAVSDDTYNEAQNLNNRDPLIGDIALASTVEIMFMPADAGVPRPAVNKLPWHIDPNGQKVVHVPIRPSKSKYIVPWRLNSQTHPHI